jgi:hypothetical protein
MATWTAAAARRGTRKARSRLTSDPHQSNRTIAHAAGVHHKTVGRLRLLLETGGVIPIIRGRGSARRVVTASSRFATGYPASPDGRGRFRLGLTPDEEDGRLCRVSLVFEYVDELVPADVRRGTHAYDEWFTAHRQSVWIGSLNFPTGALVTPTTLRSELERGLPGLARGAIVRSRRGEFASTPSPPTSLPAPNAIAGR